MNTRARSLLRDGGVRVPEGDVASTPAEARDIAERLGPPGRPEDPGLGHRPGRAGRHPVRRRHPTKPRRRPRRPARDEGQELRRRSDSGRGEARHPGRILRRPRHGRRPQAPPARLQRGRRDRASRRSPGSIPRGSSAARSTSGPAFANSRPGTSSAGPVSPARPMCRSPTS